MSERGHDFRRQLERLEGLVRTLEACPDLAAREAAREMVRTLLDLHRAGLERILELTPTDRIADRLTSDGLISSLLLLHGLHPTPIGERVAMALDRVRSRLRAQGGDADVLSADADVIRIRIRGNSCAGPTIRQIIETALTEAAPDVGSVEFEEEWERSPPTRLSLPLAGAGS